MSIVPYTGGKGEAEKVILALVERYGPKVLAYAENKITKWYDGRGKKTAPPVSDVRAIVRSELHRQKQNMEITYNPSIYYFANGSSGRLKLEPANYLPEVPSGYNDGQRVGNRIAVRGLRVAFELFNTTDDPLATAVKSNMSFRFQLCRWRFPDGTNTLPSTNTDTAVYTDVQDPDKWSVVQTWYSNINSANVVDYAGNIVPPIKSINYVKYLKMPKTFKYVDSTTQLPSNLPYYLLISTNAPDDASLHPGVRIRVRLIYENK